MTLDELLALLPDNDTGDIDAADLRTIVTDLYDRSVPVAAGVYAYNWEDDPQSGGNLNVGQWATGATTLRISNAAQGGYPGPPIVAMDRRIGAEWQVKIDTVLGGASLTATVTGPSSSPTSPYISELPITVTAATGSVPADGDPLALTTLVPTGA